MNSDLNPCENNELLIRESFKRDYKLSCPVLDDNDVFQKSLLIGDLEKEWTDYLEMSQKLGDVNSYRSKIVGSVVASISNVKGFDNLVTEPDQKRWEGPRTYLNENNLNKRLVSIDLSMANYQSLKKLGNKFVLDTNNYDELIRRFTKEECLIRSRMLRQLIFGLLKPKVQASVQRNIMYEIIDTAKTIKDFPICHLTNDEVVLIIDTDADLITLQETLQNFHTNSQSTNLLSTKFKIKKMNHGSSKLIIMLKINELWEFTLNSSFKSTIISIIYRLCQEKKSRPAHPEVQKRIEELSGMGQSPPLPVPPCACRQGLGG